MARTNQSPAPQRPEAQAASDPGCGGRPRLLAIGITPMGIISIGIVPMGVVSVGVLPMGVLSIGAVGMGLINACVVGMGVLVAGVNVMGIWWAGPEGMGPYRLESSPAHEQQRQSDEPTSPVPHTFASKAEALQKAQELGCEGVHRTGSLWIPCEHLPEP